MLPDRIYLNTGSVYAEMDSLEDAIHHLKRPR
jgi:hypothetical protein